MNDNFDKNPENNIWDDEEDYDCYEIADEDEEDFLDDFENAELIIHRHLRKVLLRIELYDDGTYEVTEFGT